MDLSNLIKMDVSSEKFITKMGGKIFSADLEYTFEIKNKLRAEFSELSKTELDRLADFYRIKKTDEETDSVESIINVELALIAMLIAMMELTDKFSGKVSSLFTGSLLFIVLVIPFWLFFIIKSYLKKRNALIFYHVALGIINEIDTESEPI